MNRIQISPLTQALLAAALFGASTPIAKLLLAQIEPIPLAALLYLGGGAGLLLYRSVQRVGDSTMVLEARLNRADVPWLTGAVLAGGVAAPILLMSSLRHTPAATASLLLNFEGVATTLIAGLVFREAIGRRVWWALACITGASMLLSWEGSAEWGFSLGALGVLGACALWGIDNNLTRNISAKDPLTIVALKGIGAGLVSLSLAVALHQPLPNLRAFLGAMLLGSLSYGLSIVLFVFAMRDLGAVRASALFGTAPFAGTLLSFPIFREALNPLFVLSLPIMVTGAALLLSEKHAHTHPHVSDQHEHRHRHDRHHRHRHAEGEIPPGGSHSHWHKHGAASHAHQHTPDFHHRHDHEQDR